MPRRSRSKSKKRVGYASLTYVLKAIRLHKENKLIPPLDPYKLHIEGGIPEWNIFILYHALEDLTLVQNGHPTETFDRLAHAYQTDQTEYQNILDDLLRRVYSDVFRRVDVVTATQEQLIIAFAIYDFPKQHRKMVTLFKGLCHEAGIFHQNNETFHEVNEHVGDAETLEILSSAIPPASEDTFMQEPAQIKANDIDRIPPKFSAIGGQVDILQHLLKMPTSPEWTKDLNHWWQDNFRTAVISLLKLVGEKESE